MQEIDFLPQRYREQSAERRQTLFRAAVAASFFLLLGVVSVRQIALKRAVQHDLEQIMDAVVASEQTHARIEALEKELALETERACLYAYLQHPWPRTNLVEAVARDVPKEIDLAELQIELQQPGGSKRRRFQPEVSPRQQTPAAASAWERDLEQLREEYDTLKTVVLVRGLTRDTDALHTYLADLSRSPYFSNAELVSLETASLRASNASQFTIRLTARPGYGQPNGPEKDTASVAMLPLRGERAAP